MRYYVVDAFADTLFSGNPAGVCLVDQWPGENVMQSVAAENNLSETAFVCKQGSGDYGLRWFTPNAEIDLCGHATLASSFVVSRFLDPGVETMRFHSMSGQLTVERMGDLYQLDFPSRPPQALPIPADLEAALGAKVLEVRGARDWVVVLESHIAVAELAPDIGYIAAIPNLVGVAVTAPGDDCDFVSRFFAPSVGVDEDPVTGSSHCSLIPYWSAKLGKEEMVARQLSRRGGTLYCRDLGERVTIAGKAALYLEGNLHIPT